MGIVNFSDAANQDTQLIPEPSPLPVSVRLDGCEDEIEIDAGAAMLESPGRILKLDVSGGAGRLCNQRNFRVRFSTKYGFFAETGKYYWSLTKGVVTMIEQDTIRTVRPCLFLFCFRPCLLLSDLVKNRSFPWLARK